MALLGKIVNKIIGGFGYKIVNLSDGKKLNNVASLNPVVPVDKGLAHTVSSRYKASFDISPECKYSASDIREAGKEFFWHYPLQFGEVFFEADYQPFKSVLDRHRKRYSHFFPHIVSLSGSDDLSGNTILDCGCNCGFWSIQSVLNNADSVVAFDAGEKNIEQAKFIQNICGIDRIKYHVADLDNFTEIIGGQYDIVFFLGLLYHINRPVEILRSVRKATKKFAVIDTTISPNIGSILYIQDDFAHDQNKCNNLCFLPTAQAVRDLLIYSGFRDVKYIPNDNPDLPEDHLKGSRMTFIAFV